MESAIAKKGCNFLEKFRITRLSHV